MEIKLKKFNDNAVIPYLGTEYSAGYDLSACIIEPIIIKPNETVIIPSGLGLEIPIGYMGLVMARSGISIKRNLAPANKVGLIDADYRGEIMVALHNHGQKQQTIEPNEKIAQIVITPFLKVSFQEVDELSETNRGDNKFGSTGK